tara:strand:+ start:14390 stop:14569 length:180 start_codon:yes stop_codon:yes gene_type:complete
MNKIYINFQTKQNGIPRPDKNINNLALNKEKKLPLSKPSLSNMIARIKGVRKQCGACGK